MVYIIGVNHQVQHNRSLPQTSEFLAFLEDFIKDKEIALIAEEWSDDASDTSAVATSTVEDFASINGIDYLACDPTFAERKVLGIRSSEDIRQELIKLAKQGPYTKEKSKEYQKKLITEDHHKRERFWLEQIQNYTDEDIIFICGTEHIGKFTSLREYGFDLLLRDEKIPVEVLTERFD